MQVNQTKKEYLYSLGVGNLSAPKKMLCSSCASSVCNIGQAAYECSYPSTFFFCPWNSYLEKTPGLPTNHPELFCPGEWRKPRIFDSATHKSIFCPARIQKAFPAHPFMRYWLILFHSPTSVRKVSQPVSRQNYFLCDQGVVFSSSHAICSAEDLELWTFKFH